LNDQLTMFNWKEKKNCT